MMEFLNLFMDCFLCPMSPDYASLEDNPFMVAMLAVLLGMGLVSMLRRLLEIWSIR